MTKTINLPTFNGEKSPVWTVFFRTRGYCYHVTFGNAKGKPFEALIAFRLAKLFWEENRERLGLEGITHIAKSNYAARFVAGNLESLESGWYGLDPSTMTFE